MNAMAEPIGFALPKKPRIKEQEPLPDQRKVCVIPFRAVFDKKLSHGALQALAALCAYCNRAGVTWVSQGRIAQDLGITQQAVAKQYKQLKDNGYLEIVRRGFRGQRSDTLRVVFDPNITAEDAITMTSNKEDTRPPAIIEEQRRQAEEIDKEGQARIARLISKALKKPINQEKTMPTTGQTRTVKKMKEDIQKAKSKRSTTTTKTVKKTVDNSVNNDKNKLSINNLEVVYDNNLEVVLNTDINYREDLSKVKSKKELNIDLNKREDLRCVLGHDGLTLLAKAGLTSQEVDDGLATLLPIYQAEGLTPKPQHLVDGLMQMKRDAT
jgi:predicted transcriptional regulator